MAETAEKSNFDEFKREKIAYLWRIGWKLKAHTSCDPYFEVFKNDLYSEYTCKYALSIKPW